MVQFFLWGVGTNQVPQKRTKNKKPPLSQSKLSINHPLLLSHSHLLGSLETLLPVGRLRVVVGADDDDVKALHLVHLGHVLLQHRAHLFAHHACYFSSQSSLFCPVKKNLENATGDEREEDALILFEINERNANVNNRETG